MAEKMYEEAIGLKRELIAKYISEFEVALRDGKRRDIENAREKLYKIFSDEDFMFK